MSEKFNKNEAMKAQRELIAEGGYPQFPPPNGRCYRCNQDIYSEITKGNFTTGISVEKASKELITGCPHCHRSYCD